MKQTYFRNLKKALGFKTSPPLKFDKSPDTNSSSPLQDTLTADEYKNYGKLVADNENVLTLYANDSPLYDNDKAQLESAKKKLERLHKLYRKNTVAIGGKKNMYKKSKKNRTKRAFKKNVSYKKGRK